MAETPPVFDAGKHYDERMAKFRSEAVPPGRIVFLGSSHIERFPTADLLPGWPIVNRGIGSDRIGIGERGILRRLDVSVFECEPAFLLLENGGNDLGELWRTGEPAIDDVARCYGKVLQAIRDRLSGLPICLVGVLPTTGRFAGMTNLGPQLNVHIRRLAQEYGCRYLPFEKDVVGKGGELRPELTEDGLHLTPEGYALWAKRIAPILREQFPSGLA